MKKPRFRKNAARHLKKKTRHEQRRKEARKAQKVAAIELHRAMKSMSEEELQAFLGAEGEDEDAEDEEAEDNLDN